MRTLYSFSLIPFGVALILGQVQALNKSSETDLPVANNEQNLACQTLNGFRALHGLEPVTINRRLLASSTHHAEVMAKTKQLEHNEHSKETSDAKKRAEKFGYDGPVAELVACGIPTAPYAVVSFMDAPYHRRLLLKPGNFDFGCDVDNGFACFVMGGTVKERIVYSPPLNAVGVPTSWDGLEDPSPMRGLGKKGPFGYPILVAAYGFEDTLSCTKGMLTRADGTIVETVLKHPENDPEAKNCIIMVPIQQLQSRTTYVVSTEFKIGNTQHTESWSFTTGSAPEPTPPKSRKAKKG